MSARLVPRTKRVEAALLLPESGVFKVGRDSSCDLPLRDASTSRLHAELERTARGWTLRDGGSANGTFVDGRRIRDALLRGGETVRFGAEEEFRFHDPSAPAGRDLGAGLLALALVPRDREVFPKTIALRTGASIVGRDATSDIVLPVGRVSGVHARLDVAGGSAQVVDHRSTNGTWVNGERVATATIRPGDEIGFGDVLFDVVRSRRLSHRGILAAASTAGVLGAAVLVFGLLPKERGEVRLWTKEMYLEQVSTSLRDAVLALEARPPSKEVARARFEIAIRSLSAADRLPPSGWSEEELRVALREASGSLTRELQGRDILRLYESARESPKGGESVAAPGMSLPDGGGSAATTPPTDALASADATPRPETPSPSAGTTSPSRSSMDLPPDASSPSRPAPSAPMRSAEGASPALVRAELAAIVAEFGIDAGRQPVPPTLLAEVERFVDWWTTDNRKYTERSIARSRAHLEIIRGELRRNLLPEVFCYLPFIESGYQEEIGSHAGAIGMWQFMPATARKYGLTVDGTVDERTDPGKSTEAACRYINDLLTMFGANAFDCAVAAYNKGEYGMVSCLRGVSWRSNWKFWDAAEKGDGCLKKETIEYVPRFLAAAIVMRRPEAFGFPRSGA